MRTQRPDLMFLGVIIAALLFAAGLTWVNYHILIPSGGNDIFAPMWEAARYVINRGGNPYTSNAVARASILLDDSSQTNRFLYPYYSIPVLAPFALITSFTLARAIWMTFMFACLVGLTFTALAFTRWRPGGLSMLFYLLFALGSVPAVRAFYLGNPALLVAFLTAAGLLMVVQKRYGVAGVFFGLTIIKPQMVIFLLVFVLLWAISNRYMGLVWSMLITILVLFGVSLWQFPLWVVANYFQLLSFFKTTFPASFAAQFWIWLPASGPRAMGVVAVVVFGWMLVEWWRAFGKDSRWFLWTASLTVTLTHLFGLPSSISNQVILLIPFALVFSLWSQRWRATGNTLSIVVMVLLTGGGWLVYLVTMDANMTAKAGILMLSLLPIMALALLYWVRYWALNSVRLKASHIEALRRL